jgi:hypothetical protein
MGRFLMTRATMVQWLILWSHLVRFDGWISPIWWSWLVYSLRQGGSYRNHIIRESVGTFSRGSWYCHYVVLTRALPARVNWVLICLLLYIWLWCALFDLCTLLDSLQIREADFTCPPWFSSGAVSLISKILDPNPRTVRLSNIGSTYCMHLWSLEAMKYVCLFVSFWWGTCDFEGISLVVLILGRVLWRLHWR